MSHARCVLSKLQADMPDCGERFSTAHFILPEQFACIAALVLMVLWMNPLELMHSLLGYGMSERGVRISAELLSIIGGYGKPPPP